MATRNLPQVRFELDPRAPKPEQVAIYVNGTLVERCALADKPPRLTAHGYQFAQAPRNGFTQNGRPISRTIARRQQGGH